MSLDLHEKDEKHDHGVAVLTTEVDTGAALVAGNDTVLDEAEATRIRCVFTLSEVARSAEI